MEEGKKMLGKKGGEEESKPKTRRMERICECKQRRGGGRKTSP